MRDREEILRYPNSEEDGHFDSEGAAKRQGLINYPHDSYVPGIGFYDYHTLFYCPMHRQPYDRKHLDGTQFKLIPEHYKEVTPRRTPKKPTKK